MNVVVEGYIYEGRMEIGLLSNAVLLRCKNLALNPGCCVSLVARRLHKAIGPIYTRSTYTIIGHVTEPMDPINKSRH